MEKQLLSIIIMAIKHYMHHQSDFAKNVKQGKAITKGELIGYVGNTGLSSGPHLHLGLYKKWQWQLNPMTVLNKPSVDGLEAKRKIEFLVSTKSIQRKLR